MPKNTDFPGIEADYTDLSDIPTANEMSVTTAGKDYNITIQQVFAAAVAIGLSDAVAADLAAQVDDYITGGGGGGGGGTVLDEDDFASNSATLAPSQQSTKVYVDTGLATKAATVHTHVSTSISDSTAAGRALLTAADVAAQKTIINQTAAEIVTALEALTSGDRLSYTGVDGLDASGAGDLYETALIASTAAADGEYLKRSGTAVVGQALGTAALLDAVPSGAPATASSSSGSITLDYAGKAVIETTTTENITTVTLSSITAYTTVLWRVKHTTARTITFPAGTKITAGVLAYVGSANSTVNILIYNDNGTYEVVIGDPLPVGA